MLFLTDDKKYTKLILQIQDQVSSSSKLKKDCWAQVIASNGFGEEHSNE